MKVICDRSALMDAVNNVASVVPARTPTPALSCVKLVARKVGGVGELTLSGTDAETSLHLTLTQVDVQQPGEVAIPADKLRAIVSAEDGEPTLTIETEGDQCHIRGTNAHFRVFAYPAKDFPAMPDFAAASGGTGPDPAKAVFSQTAGGLMEIVSRTVFATARETSRYAINGVLLKRNGKKLEMVATDGRRLALCRASLKAAGEGTGVTSAIIPTKALGLLTRVAHDPEGNVKVAITDNKAFFAFEDGEGKEKSPRAVVSTTLVEGAFLSLIHI